MIKYFSYKLWSLQKQLERSQNPGIPGSIINRDEVAEILIRITKESECEMQTGKILNLENPKCQ